jgi:branched-chain amino acid transport system substrate-binding protein
VERKHQHAHRDFDLGDSPNGCARRRGECRRHRDWQRRALTNSEALFGTTWMNGMELAIRQTNEAGGIGGQKLAFQREDDGGDSKQGTLVAQKQCDDAAMLAVIANFNSGVTIPSSDVYHRCGMPQVTNSSNPKVTKAGYANLF